MPAALSSLAFLEDPSSNYENIKYLKALEVTKAFLLLRLFQANHS